MLKTRLTSDKSVAMSVNREEILGFLGHGFQLMAERLDMDIHGAGQRWKIIAPDFSEQLSAG